MARKGATKNRTAKEKPEKWQKLTFAQVEALADKAMGDEDDPEKYLALLLPIREIELVFLNDRMGLENITPPQLMMMPLAVPFVLVITKGILSFVLYEVAE